MSKVLKSLIIILTFLPVFLDVISPSVSCRRSCRNYEKNPITIEIYSYNGETYYQELSQTGIFKNTKLNFEEYDNPKLDNHVFLGWYRVIPNYQQLIDIDTLEELEKYNGQIVEKLPTRVSNDCLFFPLLINENNLTNFLETSPITEVEVEIRLMYQNDSKNIIAKARLHETYEDVIKFYLDEDYEYIGASIINYSHESFVKNINTDKIEILDTSKKLEYNTYFTVNIYFTEK